MEALTLGYGLHLHPVKLPGTLQAMIDGITAYTETIILGYGLCSVGCWAARKRDQNIIA